MKKYQFTTENGQVITAREDDLRTVPFTEEDFAEFAYLWGDCEYDLSDNQKMFCIDAEAESLDIDFSYSGRGMMGKQCPCVRLDREETFKTDARTMEDSMGLGYVVYAQY